MKLIIILLAFTAISCATAQENLGKLTKGDSVLKKKYPNVDKPLLPFIYNFDMLYKSFCGRNIPKDTNVRFETIIWSTKAAGLYDRIMNKTTISPEYWRLLTPFRREEVVFHEMGHHILKLGHDWSGEDEEPPKCPKSMMYYRGANDCYAKNPTYYIKELFNRANCWRQDDKF